MPAGAGSQQPSALSVGLWAQVGLRNAPPSGCMLRGALARRCAPQPRRRFTCCRADVLQTCPAQLRGLRYLSSLLWKGPEDRIGAVTIGRDKSYQTSGPGSPAQGQAQRHGYLPLQGRLHPSIFLHLLPVPSWCTGPASFPALAVWWSRIRPLPSSITVRMIIPWLLIAGRSFYKVLFHQTFSSSFLLHFPGAWLMTCF